MGRMKDLHIDMLNDDWKGDPNDYLKKRIKEMKQEELCPNCMTDNLVSEDSENITCIECGYDFIRIGKNTLRFK